MPLSFLGELLDFAIAEEKRKQEAAAREQLTKLWFAHFIVKKISREQPMSYEEFMAESLKPATDAGHVARKTKKRTAEEIWEEFAPIIAADSNKE